MIEVPAATGGTVPTNTSFNAFRKTWRTWLTWTGGTRLLNCTEGGANIEGWTNAVVISGDGLARALTRCS